MNKLASLLQFYFIASLWTISLLSPALAFNDDSTDHSQSLTAIREICANGRLIKDTANARFPCKGQPVFLGRRSTYLFRDETRISRNQVLDFKLSRDGMLFYRDRFTSRLYRLDKLLDSGSSGVALYLVSTSGDVVYLNQSGFIFKNGAKLRQGASRVTIKQRDLNFVGGARGVIINPAVSRDGKAVYINDRGALYVDGKRVSARTSKVRNFKMNAHGDVFILDTAGRLFFNGKKLVDGRSTVKDYQVSPTGKLAFLTDAIANNLVFNGKTLSAGGQRVTNFHFTADGEVIYEDGLGRIWKDDKIINK